MFLKETINKNAHIYIYTYVYALFIYIYIYVYIGLFCFFKEIDGVHLPSPAFHHLPSSQNSEAPDTCCSDKILHGSGSNGFRGKECRMAWEFLMVISWLYHDINDINITS